MFVGGRTARSSSRSGVARGTNVGGGAGGTGCPEAGQVDLPPVACRIRVLSAIPCLSDPVSTPRAAAGPPAAQCGSSGRRAGNAATRGRGVRRSSPGRDRRRAPGPRSRRPPARQRSRLGRQPGAGAPTKENIQSTPPISPQRPKSGSQATSRQYHHRRLLVPEQGRPVRLQKPRRPDMHQP
jgi:hypothetical protein